MTAIRNWHQPAVRCAVWGALSFGAGLGICHAVVAGVDAVVHIPDFNAALKINILGYMLAGAAGGTALSLCQGRKNVWLPALAVALGLGLGNGVGWVMESALMDAQVNNNGPFVFFSIDVEIGRAHV